MALCSLCAVVIRVYGFGKVIRESLAMAMAMAMMLEFGDLKMGLYAEAMLGIVIVMVL